MIQAAAATAAVGAAVVVDTLAKVGAKHVGGCSSDVDSIPGQHHRWGLQKGE